jgi:hypothetical protein
LYDEFFRPIIGIDDDVSMSTWSTAPSISDLTVRAGMPGHGHTHARHLNDIPAWTHRVSQRAHQKSPGRNCQRSRRGKDNSVIVSLEDEQLEGTFEVVSPSKKDKELPLGFSTQHHDQRSRPLTAQTSTPTFTQPVLPVQVPVSSRVGTHGMAKKTSFDNSNTTASIKSQTPAMRHKSYSSDKENRNPSQSWLPAPSSYANLTPTSSTFAQGGLNWKPDVHLKSSSSIFPNLSEYDQSNVHLVSAKPNSAHAPSGFGGIKSRKEGMAADSTRLSEQDVRHDQSLLPAVGSGSIGIRKIDTNSSDKEPHYTPATPADVEVIDIDAIDSKALHDTERFPYFKPSHKSGMSSMDSTIRLERTLYSALGEELGSFGQQIDTPSMGPELAQALIGTTAYIDRSSTGSLMNDSEPAVKRKRQDTLGDEQCKSPTNKREKSKQAGVEEGHP